jgi:peptide/nickel transport system ATP-binding protein
MELGETEMIFEGIHHPYTEALLSAVASVDGEAENRIPLTGEIPSPANPPSGCVFHTRCHRAVEGLCEVTEPAMVEIEPGHKIKCHLTAEQLSQPVVIRSNTLATLAD